MNNSYFIETELVFQHACKSAHFNKYFVVLNDSQRDQLIKQCDQPNKELLHEAFVKHCDVMNFQGDSGLIPHMIMALHVYIQRISPSFYR